MPDGKLPEAGRSGTVGWELRAHPKNIEKIDLFARDVKRFVPAFVVRQGFTLNEDARHYHLAFSAFFIDATFLH
jgi:hypothetical protein